MLGSSNIRKKLRRFKRELLLDDEGFDNYVKSLGGKYQAGFTNRKKKREKL